ncbi:hypothetical protein E2562_035336 [Oryza meyeriana var. granulata]|uniref:Uncharacterized protein n=1 Tax=Oryza meyeriana var. granulata TaxID=110450 RepID=A0A6G1DSD2_9ORYZ|nr:hypothetical protein E2562_035336 [Oryza meyeriana var. granulata]
MAERDRDGKGEGKDSPASWRWRCASSPAEVDRGGSRSVLLVPLSSDSALVCGEDGEDGGGEASSERVASSERKASTSAIEPCALPSTPGRSRRRMAKKPASASNSGHHGGPTETVAGETAEGANRLLLRLSLWRIWARRTGGGDANVMQRVLQRGGPCGHRHGEGEKPSSGPWCLRLHVAAATLPTLSH